MLSQHENKRLHNSVQLIAQHCVIGCMKNVESRNRKFPWNSEKPTVMGKPIVGKTIYDVSLEARGSGLAARGPGYRNEARGSGNKDEARGSRLAARSSRAREPRGREARELASLGAREFESPRYSRDEARGSYYPCSRASCGITCGLAARELGTCEPRGSRHRWFSQWVFHDCGFFRIPREFFIA